MTYPPELVSRLRKLKDDIHNTLANHMVYPKSLITMLKDRPSLTLEQIEKCSQYIDDSIKAVDAKFSDLLAEIESGGSG